LKYWLQKLSVELTAEAIWSARQGIRDLFESTAFGVYAKPNSMTVAANINRAAPQYPKNTFQREPVPISVPKSHGATMPPMAVPAA
jgi:hypothetical protein